MKDPFQIIAAKVLGVAPLVRPLPTHHSAQAGSVKAAEPTLAPTYPTHQRGNSIPPPAGAVRQDTGYVGGPDGGRDTPRGLPAAPPSLFARARQAEADSSAAVTTSDDVQDHKAVPVVREPRERENESSKNALNHGVPEGEDTRASSVQSRAAVDGDLPPKSAAPQVRDGKAMPQIGGRQGPHDWAGDGPEQSQPLREPVPANRPFQHDKTGEPLDAAERPEVEPKFVSKAPHRAARRDAQHDQPSAVVGRTDHPENARAEPPSRAGLKDRAEQGDPFGTTRRPAGTVRQSIAAERVPTKGRTGGQDVSVNDPIGTNAAPDITPPRSETSGGGLVEGADVPFGQTIQNVGDLVQDESRHTGGFEPEPDPERRTKDPVIGDVQLDQAGEGRVEASARLMNKSRPRPDVATAQHVAARNTGFEDAKVSGEVKTPEPDVAGEGMAVRFSKTRSVDDAHVGKPEGRQSKPSAVGRKTPSAVISEATAVGPIEATGAPDDLAKPQEERAKPQHAPEFERQDRRQGRAIEAVQKSRKSGQEIEPSFQERSTSAQPVYFNPTRRVREDMGPIAEQATPDTGRPATPLFDGHEPVMGRRRSVGATLNLHIERLEILRRADPSETKSFGPEAAKKRAPVLSLDGFLAGKRR